MSQRHFNNDIRCYSALRWVYWAVRLQWTLTAQRENTRHESQQGFVLTDKPASTSTSCVYTVTWQPVMCSTVHFCTTTIQRHHHMSNTHHWMCLWPLKKTMLMYFGLKRELGKMKGHSVSCSSGSIRLKVQYKRIEFPILRWAMMAPVIWKAEKQLL